MKINDRRGSALLAVLWLSAVLGAIAFAMASTVRGEAERASTALESTRDYYLATGAIQRAILRMMWGPLDQGVGGTPHPVLASNVLNLSFASGETVVEIIPETAKINVNTASPEVLFRLLMNRGVASDRARTIALAIADWRGPAPGATAFDQYYLSLDPSFRARHASLEEIEELLLVQGMTPDIYYGSYETVPQAGGHSRLVPRGALKDCVSIYGALAQYDVNSAPPAVLATIGLPPDVVASVVERRRIHPFQPQDLAGLMQAAGRAAGNLGLGGNSIYTLRATARLRLPDGRLSDLRRTVAALVKFMPPGYDAPYHILRWYENAWSN